MMAETASDPIASHTRPAASSSPTSRTRPNKGTAKRIT